MTTIKTKDLTLRPIKESDAQNYLECHQDKEARKNYIDCPDNLEEAKKEIQEIQKSSQFFCIEIDHHFVGFIFLELNNLPRSKHSAFIGFGIHENFRNKNIATKAVKEITSYAFQTLNLKRINATVRTFNKTSAKVLEKAGYIYEGTLKKNKCSNGKYLDDMMWAKTN